jgi:transposase InsO family protein
MRVAERYELAAELRERYRAASRAQKRELLDAFCLATGYNRKYAIEVLKGRARSPRPLRRPRAKTYGGEAFRRWVAQAWEASGYVCAERLQPVLPEMVRLLRLHHRFKLDAETERLLAMVSVSTLRRTLATMRDDSGWGRPRMRPPTRLRGQVPIVLQNLRPFEVPGHLQIDLVTHSGRWATGEWLWTLCGTDLCTGWTELVPVLSKAQKEVLDAVAQLHRRLPFPLLSLHTDNGYEFLSGVLIAYCRQQGVMLSRGRPHHTNDNAHVEQKNGYVVRRLLGDHRLDSPAQLEWMLELYEQLRIFVNCYQPVMKRIGVVHRGETSRRVHDLAQTPLRRLLDTGQYRPEALAEFTRIYNQVSPLTLKREIGQQLQRRPAAAYIPPGRPWPKAAIG